MLKVKTFRLWSILAVCLSVCLSVCLFSLYLSPLSFSTDSLSLLSDSASGYTVIALSAYFYASNSTQTLLMVCCLTLHPLFPDRYLFSHSCFHWCICYVALL